MVDADDIFDDREYAFGTPTVAKPTRNFYTYFSTTHGTRPILGFSGVPEVYVSSWDYYDVKDSDHGSLGQLTDQHRLSIFTGITYCQLVGYFFKPWFKKNGLNHGLKKLTIMSAG